MAAGEEECRSVARACSEALALDASVPRPGLASITRPRRPMEAEALLALVPRGWEACFCSCLHGFERRRGWMGCWLDAVEDLAVHGYGNPGLGSLLLLSLQAAATGAAAGEGREDRDEAVMGWALRLVELEGVDGAAAFYQGLAAAAPRYLGRISWSGLPDASQPGLAVQAIYESGVTLLDLARAASLYDPVLGDVAAGLGYSVGSLLPALEEYAASHGLEEGFRLLLLDAVRLYGDLLVRRKLGRHVEELLARSRRGGLGVAEAWKLLRGAGPGSAADLTVSAAARLLYRCEAEGRPMPLLHPWTSRFSP